MVRCRLETRRSTVLPRTMLRRVRARASRYRRGPRHAKRRTQLVRTSLRALAGRRQAIDERAQLDDVCARRASSAHASRRAALRPRRRVAAESKSGHGTLDERATASSTLAARARRQLAAGHRASSRAELGSAREALSGLGEALREEPESLPELIDGHPQCLLSLAAGVEPRRAALQRDLTCVSHVHESPPEGVHQLAHPGPTHAGQPARSRNPRCKPARAHQQLVARLEQPRRQPMPPGMRS